MGKCIRCGQPYIEHAECSYYDSKALNNNCDKFTLNKSLNKALLNRSNGK